MTKELYAFMQYIITNSYISVLNTPEYTEYFIDTDIEDEPIHAVLHTQYSNLIPGDISVQYLLYINNEHVAYATVPIMKSQGKTNNAMKNKKQSADQLETLIKMCSNKIIIQEIDAQKNKMLKSFGQHYSKQRNN